MPMTQRAIDAFQAATALACSLSCQLPPRSSFEKRATSSGTW